MAREIENARGAFLFRDFDAFRAQPIRKEGVATAGIDGHVRAKFFDRAAVLGAQALNQERSAFAPRKKSTHAGIGHETNAGKARRVAAHEELECRAAGEEESHVPVLPAWARNDRAVPAVVRLRSGIYAHRPREALPSMRDSARG